MTILSKPANNEHEIATSIRKSKYQAKQPPKIGTISVNPVDEGVLTKLDNISDRVTKIIGKSEASSVDAGKSKIGSSYPVS